MVCSPPMTASRNSRPPARAALVKTVVAALDDMKAVNVKVMDVRKVTDVADCMILASGNSDRHVRSIADKVVEKAKAAGFRPMGMEGERDGEWVLVDLNDVIVHVMLPRVREFYGLEGLWDVSPARPGKPAKAAKTSKAAKSARSAPRAKQSAGSKGKRATRAAPAKKKKAGPRAKR
ncbi:MAG TPA: ribosome silencing factor [Steroidobacteraceae bacterium]|nr:ribosome silencing factor [Steroidobacteraceae bacterium]